jgi:hypothetical protein
MKSTFIVQEDSPRLSEKEHTEFDSKVAKLLFLGKRARPDILTVVISLYMGTGSH